MSGMPSSSSSKKPTPKSKQRRHKCVADDIQETHPESVKCLLAALEKAQKGTTVDSSEKEKQKQTVGARVARNRNDSGENPSSSRQRTSNSISAGPSRVYNNGNNNNNNSNNNNNNCNKQNKGPLPQKVRVPKDVLDDLCFRFIEHIPEHEKFVNTRVCFQVELAHWFYVDYYVNKEISSRSDCPNMGIREFAWSIFSNSPELKRLARYVDDVLDEWRHYKSNVPTYGGILLDKTLTKVLLVQGFYSSKNSWGFPKGKVNENETPRNCAAREVDEETGFNFKDFSPGKEYKIQKFIGDTMVRLYIIPDVPLDFEFKPKTRNEIRDIQWFTVADLPTDKNDQVHRMGNYSNNNFYTVMPFVQDLQNYIKKEQARRAKVAKTQPPVQPPQKKMTPTDMLSSLSQVNMDQASMTPGKSDASPNILSNLFNNFLPNKQPQQQQQQLTYQNMPAYNAFVTPAPASQIQAKPIASMNSAFSPFKPVDENIAQSLLNIVKPPKPQSKNSPKIAHPIAITGRPKLPSVEQHLQDQRPTPPKQKIGPSETSAFKAIPKNKSSSSLKGDSEMGSVFGSELALDRCETRDSIPSCATDILEELRGREGQHFTVQLCDAWKGFKLDVAAINRDLPAYPLF